MEQKITKIETPRTKTEGTADILASDLQKAFIWVKKNPLKAVAIGAVGVLAVRNKLIRGVLGSATVALISSKTAKTVEHNLH